MLPSTSEMTPTSVRKHSFENFKLCKHSNMTTLWITMVTTCQNRVQYQLDHQCSSWNASKPTFMTFSLVIPTKTCPFQERFACYMVSHKASIISIVYLSFIEILLPQMFCLTPKQPQRFLILGIVVSLVLI